MRSAPRARREWSGQIRYTMQRNECNREVGVPLRRRSGIRSGRSRTRPVHKISSRAQAGVARRAEWNTEFSERKSIRGGRTLLPESGPTERPACQSIRTVGEPKNDNGQGGHRVPDSVGRRVVPLDYAWNLTGPSPGHPAPCPHGCRPAGLDLQQGLPTGRPTLRL